MSALLEALPRPLSAREGEALRAYLRALLAWHRTLRAWPAPRRSAPPGVPFLSLYCDGRMVGCYGSAEGDPGERLARAFLRASADARFGATKRDPRGRWSASLCYPTRLRAGAPEELLAALEPGVHGVLLAREDGARVPVLPSVARELGLDARGLLQAASRKAGLPPDAWERSRVELFEAEELVVFERWTPEPEEPQRAAARWLASLVERDGRVRYGMDARTGEELAATAALYARAAVALAALGAVGGYGRALARGRRWLRAACEGALRGSPPPLWPEAPGAVAGTLSLATLAGALEPESLARWAHARAGALSGESWYAAQLCLALGPRAPRSLWEDCVRDLDARPFAPWTALAARARGDARTLERVERALCAALRSGAPHEGGAAVTAVPQLALTAAAVEALREGRGAEVRAAAARGRRFLERWQWRGERVPAFAWAERVDGAFPATPVDSLLRCDVAGHAALALRA